MEDGTCSSCADKAAVTQSIPSSGADSVIVARRVQELHEFRVSNEVLAGMRAALEPMNHLQRNSSARSTNGRTLRLRDWPSAEFVTGAADKLSGPHHLGLSVIEGGPLQGTTVGSAGIAGRSEAGEHPSPELITAECTLEQVKKAILENKDFKDQSISYVDKAIKTDESMTKEEIVKHAKTLGDQGAVVDTWGMAYFFIDYDVQTKYKFVNLDCCCIWVESLTVTLTRQMFIAKDVPKEEREQTVWHEERHFKDQKEVFDGKEFRDAIAAIPGLKFDKKNPDCKRLQPEKSCEESTTKLRDEILAELGKIVTAAATAIREKAEDFHDKEEDLWKKHKAGKK